MAKPELANAAHPVWWDERQQGQRSSIAQETALSCRGRSLRSVVQLVHRSDPRLLHILPLEPATDALLVHLLSLTRFLCLPPQVDQLREWVGLCVQNLSRWLKVGVGVGGDRDEAVQIVGDRAEFAVLVVLQPCRVALSKVAQVSAAEQADGTSAP